MIQTLLLGSTVVAAMAIICYHWEKYLLKKQGLGK